MQQASQYDGTLELEFSILIIIHLLLMLVVRVQFLIKKILDSLGRSTLDRANVVRELFGVCDVFSDKSLS